MSRFQSLPARILAVVILFAISSTVWFFLANKAEQKRKETSIRIQNQHAQEIVKAVEQLKESAIQAVKEKLRDPSSAQFRNMEVGVDWICGQVNAKNGFGGYTGFTSFAVHRPASTAKTILSAELLDKQRALGECTR